MTRNFYDVVILGTQLRGLVCGALLAKRGFRVLLLGQDDLPPTYRIGALTLPRSLFNFDLAKSPIAHRIWSEIACTQAVRRQSRSVEPSFQTALPRHRLDVSADPRRFHREVAREFPEVQRPIDDFHRSCLESAQQLDEALGRDLTWPPHSLLERRELARATAHQPFLRNGPNYEPLREFALDHRFRFVAQAPARMGSDLVAEQTNALALTRLYANAVRGTLAFPQGEQQLRSILLRRIETYTGEIRLHERAEQVLVRRHCAQGVRLARSSEQVGAVFVISATDAGTTARLLPDPTAFDALFDRAGEPQTARHEYVLNVVLRAEGVPVGLGRDAFFVRDSKRSPDGLNLLHVRKHEPAEDGSQLLTVLCRASRRRIEDSSAAQGVREEALSALGEFVPFLGKHVLFIDSPHDGRDLQDVASGKLIASNEPWTRGPATMRRVYRYPSLGALGVCALPTRTPIRRLLLCNSQNVPGLGLEGQWLAAWSAARVVSRSDRKKEWMRRGLWTKAEL